ncbi:MAG TPA: bifunctional DNA-binding transcriptional regulator/O6-methylguanine-DNA methyltransferase Ada, partial [Pyrinomonadaceae bacterium]|nr:bifunctional DNA-binding transcriptional regulator/O6-methylguanine-DNA methyltransferase Ada [Pyrinomonadaceae bacterium]
YQHRFLYHSARVFRYWRRVVNLALKEVVTKQIITDENRWQAVVARDRSMDGQFVFAVSSTKIYCRPSCPSRRPNRERVAFFVLPEAAEQAGYRACKRCEPRRANVSDPQIEMVQRVCRYIRANQTNALDLTELARLTTVSVFHLQRTFKNIMGVSPRQYAAAERFGDFKSRLREGDSVTGALYDAGLNSSRRLYEQSNDELGMTPATYGRGGRGAKIVFTTAPCSLGRLLVARTERGVCAVKIGDNDGEMEQELRKEFFAAQIDRAGGTLAETLNDVLSLIETNAPHPNLPLDIRATAFQRQVWEKLRSIAYGETMSYGDVAKALGNPGAVRAVGRACGSNPVAFVIPCHRVVREDKSLGGYRWGLERKKKILEREAAGRNRE